MLWGMFFANLVVYYVMLSMGSLHASGATHIENAAKAASALPPTAGSAAGYLFAIGVAAVGFLAVPVMTTGAA